MADNITLQAEIDKLNGRLKKAVQVFNEQKTNIERLTSERDDALQTIKVRVARIDELESKLAEKEQDDNKFFEQLQVIDTLNETITELQKSVAVLMEKNDELKSELDKKGTLLESADTKIASLEKVVAERVADLKSIADVFATTAAAVTKSATSVKKKKGRSLNNTSNTVQS